MGHIKDITNQSKIQSFPNSTFEINGDPPLSQCSDALFQGETAFTNDPPGRVVDFSHSFPIGVIGNFVTITESPTGNPGTYLITARPDPNTLTTGAGPGNSGNVHYYVHNGGAFAVPRDFQSFIDFITDAGYAYTIKGGKLHTNIPAVDLQPACKILFAPLT